MTVECREVTRLLECPEWQRVSVATRDSRALGLLVWNVWSDEIELIRVADMVQRQGVARRLLEWTEDHVGHPLRPTGDYTPEGLAFWQALGRKPGRTRRVPDGEDVGNNLLAYIDDLLRKEPA